MCFNCAVHCCQSHIKEKHTMMTIQEEDETRTRSKKEEEEEEDEDEEDDANKNVEHENEDDANNETIKSKRKRKRKRKSKSGGEKEDDDDSNNNKVVSSIEHTIYVEGIPFDCTEDDVREWFVSKECHDILQLRLPRWQDSGRLRGYGHVVFASESSHTRALEALNGQSMGNRYLTIQQARTAKPDTSMGANTTRPIPEQPEDCTTVFVKNLPYEATEEDIAQVFCVCGKIKEGGVRVARNYESRQSKGFAYVDYKNPEGAHAAVRKAAQAFGMTVLGRPCFVDYDQGRIKGSFKTAQGKLWTKEYHHGTTRNSIPSPNKHKQKPQPQSQS